MRALSAVLFAICAALLAAPSADAATRPETGQVRRTTTAFAAPKQRRPRVRIYRETYDRGVIPSYFPGSNAVRDCSVAYVREFRPSGTVIAPHMKCVWRQP